MTEFELLHGSTLDLSMTPEDVALPSSKISSDDCKLVNNLSAEEKFA